MTTACGIFLFFLHKKGKRTGKKQHKTCNGHCTSEYDLHKCNFKNSSAIQIKVFELLFEAKKKKKTVEELGGSGLVLQQHPFSWFQLRT